MKEKYERHSRHGAALAGCLEIRVIMIPLPENTAAGAASGDSCGVKGGCRVFRQPCRAVLHIPSHTGGGKMKNHAGGDCSMISGMACGSYFVDKVRFRYRFQGKAGRIHIFTVPDCRGIRHQGRETPDKRIY